MTRPHPHAVKIELEKLAMEAGVVIVGLHSVLMADDTVASAIYDVQPDVDGCGLAFSFELPELVSKSDLGMFALWLAAPPDEMRTVH